MNLEELQRGGKIEVLERLPIDFVPEYQFEYLHSKPGLIAIKLTREEGPIIAPEYRIKIGESYFKVISRNYRYMTLSLVPLSR